MPEPIQLFITVFIFLFGLSFGSFLNVVVYRIPRKLSIVQPPSRCPSCDYRLGFTDLIPIFGYLILKGRCRKCGVKISPRYPLVELATGLLFLLVYLFFYFSIEFFFYLILLFILLAISLIDLEHRIVPNRLVLFGSIAGFIFYLPKLSSHFFQIPTLLIIEMNPLDALFGMLLGSGIMLAIFLVSRGGMGAGDIKLMAMIGIYVGLRGVAVTLFIGFLFGALVGITFMVLGKLTRKDALPFAPFLSLATLIEVFWGFQLWNWYINLSQ